MIQELIKLKTEDNIELTGLLYKPKEETKKVVIHVHGFAGNFYENSFVDFQSKAYTDIGYSYFPFNNRGNNYLAELIKKENDNVSYVMGGGAYESFADSYYDIDAATNYVKSLGYNEIILQGHSYGCNKVINYYLKNNNNINGIILLAPCDLAQTNKDFINGYEEYLNKNKKLYEEKKYNELVFTDEFPPLVFSVKTFIEDWTENTKSDIFKYRINGYINESLKTINIPILVQIGDKDNASLVLPKEIVTEYLNNNINKLTLKFIQDANHGYIGKEQEMSDNCVEWLNTL